MQFVAEIGCNHLGDFRLAKEMIKVFAKCGADIIKFQKRNPKECLTEEQYNAPHPHPDNSYADTYGLHRESLEFTMTQHAELKDDCESVGVEYMTSVWDLTSAREIVALNPKQIKIPSPINNNKAMLDFICDNFTGDIHISTGMTSASEFADIVKRINKNPGQFILYHSVSSYPTMLNDLHLSNILMLKKYCRRVGFSGHHIGIDADIAAAAYGIDFLERHVTLCRMFKGTDHSFSLEPSDFSNLVLKLKSIGLALRDKEKEILDCEEEFRLKLKRTT